ncbi:MAG TPA: CHAT domain-containing protein [Candidatus Angelobacter sp.]|nr:CHAT domain-containing protein [Candidatus Angelobacter sp.]
MDHETRHISFEELAALASGKLSVRRSEEIEGHLAGCALCRQQLQEYEQFVTDAQTPASNDLTDEWKELQRRLRPKKVITMQRWLPATAAAIILVAGLSWSALDRIRNRPQRWLAQAYHERRTSDLRPAEAAHASVSAQKGEGSAFNRPLAIAHALLLDELDKNPSDPKLLRLRAEAEMMESKANDAVQSLEQALNLRANDPDILADLGTAYALRGDLEHRKDDYITASDYLGRSLRLRPQAPRAMFNLALVFERIMLYDQAIKAWQDYLKVGEADGGWSKEAKERLDDLQEQIKARQKKLGEIRKGPENFVAMPATSRFENAEAYLSDHAVPWLAGFDSDETKRQAVKMLADALKQHSDFWLADVLASGMGPGMIAGFKKLEDADPPKDIEARLADARQAIHIFLRAHSAAGVLRARFSELVFLHNLFRTPECLAAAAALRSDLQSHEYARMRARVEIEYSICAMRAAKLDEAESSLRQAMEISALAGFGITELEAGNRYLSIAGHVGLRSEIFNRAQKLLDTFWSRPYEFYLFYQVVDDLRELAGRADQPDAALFLARSAEWAAHEQADPQYEGPALANLAVAAETIGQDAEARENLKLSDRMLIPAAYQVGPGTDLATVELERGEIDNALQRLEKLDDKLKLATSAETVSYYSALGEAYRKKGLLPKARNAFLQSIDLAKQRLASKAGERAGVLKSIEDSYRRLVAVTLAHPGGELDALRIWQEYQALDARIDAESIHRSNDPVLSYIELPDGFAAWLLQGNQVKFNRLAAKPDAREIATRFPRLCSDPQSNWQDLRRDAQQLYAWMIGPFEQQLNQPANNQNQPRQLIVELDGALAGIPMQALMSADGKYLGDQFFILNSVGLRARELRQETFSRDTRALVIANPALGASADQFSPLPDSLKEADAVQNAFSVKPLLLEGRGATITALQDRLPTVELVHFSGHGYVNGENGALLFAATDTTSPYNALRSSEVARQDWSRIRLVVLSACSAAAGETRGPHNPDSLVRALISAGPPRVVAALWNVDSGATLELMREFYKSLGQGKTPDQALHAAQQKIRLGSQGHAYYWAGLQLYGTR